MGQRAALFVLIGYRAASTRSSHHSFHKRTRAGSMILCESGPIPHSTRLVFLPRPKGFYNDLAAIFIYSPVRKGVKKRSSHAWLKSTKRSAGPYHVQAPGAIIAREGT